MLNKISLAHFRNHKSIEFSFSEQVVIVGQNAVGKTNLLEAIYTSITGFGFRGKDDELIQQGEDWLRIDLETESAKRTVKIQSDNKITKTLEVDGVKKTPRSFRENTAVVLFEPNLLRMLSGPPDLRRTWVDNLVSQIDPVYEDSLKRYKRVLFQRNNLLKKAASDDELFVWELKLGEYGQKLVESRSLFFHELNSVIESLYSSISRQNDAISVEYNPQNKAYASWLISELQTRRARDKILGFTSVGPHRDDFVIRHKESGSTFSNIGSRGELRSMALALKFYELKLLENRLGLKPVLLLDDVFSELDSTRRKSLIQTAQEYQSFFTATDLPDFLNHKTTQVIELAP